MVKTYLIGVDIGTSVVKSSVCSSDGVIAGSASREVRLRQPSQGIAEQDPDEFVALTLETIRDALEASAVSSADIHGIAFDGQMAGAMAIDEAWNALTPWYPSALDTRYQPYLDQMVESAGDTLFASNGALPFTAPRIAWWRDQSPDIYKRIKKVLIISNYVAGKLADLGSENAFIDPSYLTWIGTSDTAHRRWSPELARAIGIDLDLLPRVVSASTVVGTLGSEFASQCGLPSGVPIVAGAGDQVAACIGAGVVRAGQLSDAAGTFPVLATCVDRFIADTEHSMLVPLAGPLADQWFPIMYISGGGLTHRWFTDHLGETDNAGNYAAFDALAAEISPGADGLLCVPHLIGRGCPADPDVRGAWIGFTFQHGRGHFYRAILESIAYDFADALAVIREYRPDSAFAEVRVTGGGARSDLWNQIKSDVLGIPYRRLKHEDTSAIGCAVLAGHAVGIFDDIRDGAERLAPTADLIEPRREYRATYDRLIDAYRRAFDDLRPTYTRLAALRDV